jgi:hypothetical protein
MTKEGEKRRSILTGKVYQVNAIKDRFVVLGSLDGSSQVWTEKDNLKLFYEKVENEQMPEGLVRSPTKPKRLRSPASVVLDFL